MHLGAPLEEAQAAMVLLHGRGASAGDIMGVAQELMTPGWAYLAPDAAGSAWYPQPFTAPMELNEPWLSSALEFVSEVMATVGRSVPAERTMVLGFSQGACLGLEWTARNPRRYAGIVGLSGGLIGPDIGPREYPGTLAGTPTFLGCSDVDPYIPKERVVHAGEVLEAMGGEVVVRLYPGMPHTVSPEELELVRAMMTAPAAPGVSPS
ncbi:MAG: phospholipase/carboxylesterase [Chloroflexota bacterium]|jgi:predicted esterase|nr:phospholipase/carboxylesterase [Chloroflexota bacterium]